jgi:hypothetical protein
LKAEIKAHFASCRIPHPQLGLPKSLWSPSSTVGHHACCGSIFCIPITPGMVPVRRRPLQHRARDSPTTADPRGWRRRAQPEGEASKGLARGKRHSPRRLSRARLTEATPPRPAAPRASPPCLPACCLRRHRPSLPACPPSQPPVPSVAACPCGPRGEVPSGLGLVSYLRAGAAGKRGPPAKASEQSRAAIWPAFQRGSLEKLSFGIAGWARNITVTHLKGVGVVRTYVDRLWIEIEW